jgi:ribosomal silencing factor RsfS
MTTPRLFIYPKDLVRITGKSERHCRAIIATIKKKMGKDKHQLVTVKEYCDFAGVDCDAVVVYLR